MQSDEWNAIAEVKRQVYARESYQDLRDSEPPSATGNQRAETASLLDLEVCATSVIAPSS